ncbi:MAG: aldo/keto reductase [Acidobacteriia bacterium]|nr:aldo/keto reductase [Terriglobia bacterium]MYG02644.1 aldo/keto reductase [Terriglobia bacterium]MYK10024.1 aldo/keto reductase [Terriglobia bacterium]
MERITRRDLGKGAAIAGALGAGAEAHAAQVGKRQLGKTGLEVGVLGIGTGPLGQKGVSQDEVNNVIAAAGDYGVNYLDTAPIYNQAERRLGPALKGKRDKFVLVTKVEATSKQDATWQVKESLQKTRAEYFDLVHLHNVGRTDRFPSLDILLGEDGALAALEELKRQGLVKHVGMTCHLRPRRALPVMRSGRVEVVMAAVNCIDRQIYDFEGTVFSEAAERGMGIVAMKILGGTQGDGAILSDEPHYGRSVRYALGIPGLSVAIMGMKSLAELEKAVATVNAFKPLEGTELSEAMAEGKRRAAELGEHRGPVI